MLCVLNDKTGSGYLLHLPFFAVHAVAIQREYSILCGVIHLVKLLIWLKLSRA